MTKLDAEARVATLSTKETVGYERALIATGSDIRRLQLEGDELEGLHYVRVHGNVDSIRSELDGTEAVACVGGSFIGCEVAASLTVLGKSVTIVMLENEPLDRVFGDTAGAFFRRVLEEHGVTVIGGDEIDRFVGEGRVERVVTKGGHEIDAELVVCGVGVTPDVRLAKGAAASRSATAAGSAAIRTWHERRGPVGGGRRLRVRERRARRRRLRVEHADHAWNQGHYAGRRCSARMSRTTSSPTSSATSRTGPRSSTSARRATGTRRS